MTKISHKSFLTLPPKQPNENEIQSAVKTCLLSLFHSNCFDQRSTTAVIWLQEWTLAFTPWNLCTVTVFRRFGCYRYLICGRVHHFCFVDILFCSVTLFPLPFACLLSFLASICWQINDPSYLNFLSCPIHILVIQFLLILLQL